MASIASMPHDLFQEFLTHYFLEEILSEEYIDEVPLPATLMVLQFVSRRFRAAVLREKTLCFKAIANFRDQANTEGKGFRFIASACKRYGSIPLIHWLLTHLKYSCQDRDCLDGAVEGGHVDLVKWLVATYPQCRSPTASYYLACSGRPEVLLWAEETFPQGEYSRESCLTKAIRYGHFSLVQWIEKRYQHPFWTNMHSETLIREAMGSVEMLRFVLSKLGRDMTQREMDASCELNVPIEVLRFLQKEKGLRLTEAHAMRAVVEDQLDTLKFVLSKEGGVSLTDTFPRRAFEKLSMRVLGRCHFQLIRFFYANYSHLFSEATRAEAFALCHRTMVLPDVLRLIAPDPNTPLPSGLLTATLVSQSYYALETLQYLISERKMTPPTEEALRLYVPRRRDVDRFLQQLNSKK